MVVRLLSVVLVLSLAMLPEVSFAQKAGGANTEKVSGPRKPLTIIVFAGVAGAILGLSTLSFYGRPQDKLANIAVGFAIGIISGAVYTTYKAAASPKDFYGSEQNLGSTLLAEQARDSEMRYSHGAAPVKANFELLHF